MSSQVRRPEPALGSARPGGGEACRATEASLSRTNTPGSFVARKTRFPEVSCAPVSPTQARRGQLSVVLANVPSSAFLYLGRSMRRKKAIGSVTSPPSSTPWNGERGYGRTRSAGISALSWARRNVRPPSSKARVYATVEPGATNGRASRTSGVNENSAGTGTPDGARSTPIKLLSTVSPARAAVMSFW